MFKEVLSKSPLPHPIPASRNWDGFVRWRFDWQTVAVEPIFVEKPKIDHPSP
jgi:hypothetical protein